MKSMPKIELSFYPEKKISACGTEFSQKDSG